MAKYDAKPKPERVMDLSKIANQVREYFWNQSDAFSGHDVARALGIKDPSKIKSTLYSLTSQGEIIRIRVGTSKNNPNVWSTPEAIAGRIENGLSENEAINQLLAEYDTRRSMELNTRADRVRSYIEKQQEAFSGHDVARALGIKDPDKVTLTLHRLRLRGEVTHLKAGTTRWVSPMWSNPKVVTSGMKNGLSKDEVINQLLAEYDAKTSTEPFNLNVRDKIRGYIKKKLVAVSSRDVSEAVEITPEQSVNALRGLSNQGEVRLLRAGTSKNNPGIWSTPKVIAETRKHDLSEDKAIQLLLYVYDANKTLEASQEADTGLIFQLDEQQNHFIAETLFLLADQFPDKKFTEQEKYIFMWIVGQHIGLGSAFLNLTESLQTADVEILPGEANFLILKTIGLSEADVVFPDPTLPDLSLQMEIIKMTELLYTVVAVGRESLDGMMSLNGELVN